MTVRPIRLLLVEDNVDQLLLTQRAFKRFDPEIQVVSVKNGQECLDRLAREDFSVVVLDYSLPQIDGMEVLRRIRKREYDVPIIMVTGQGDEKAAVEAMKNGAYDYLIKTQSYLKDLPSTVEKAVEKHGLQIKLSALEQKYKRLTENANDLIFTTDRYGNFTFLTNRVASVLGYPADELLGKNFKSLLLQESKEKAEKEFNVETQSEVTRLIELDFITQTGKIKSFELGLTTLLEAGKVASFEAIGRDVTHRKLLEKEILQRNKELTTLLSVTSAIAHSLEIQEISNNSLQNICEHTGLNCGALYTLCFNHTSMQLSGSYNLPDHFIESLREKSFWNDILDSFLEFRPPILYWNPHKTPASGSLSSLIELCQREQVQSFILLPLFLKEKLLAFIFGGSFSPNSFLPQEIEILMSVVYGIISRHGGSIKIESELGKGTTCSLHFPAAKRLEKISHARAFPVDKQKLRILVIDDEEIIREFLAEIFVSSGYKANTAATGLEGIALFERNSYDLVFSDLGLPDMSGWEVAKTIRAKKRDVPIILLSGWGIQLNDDRVRECGIDLVLSKPCRMEEILSGAEEVLGRRKHP